MNIGQAKSIPVSYLLEKLGIKPTRKSQRETWYLSPFRNEKTASFHVNEKRNIWFDFGIGQGGDIIDLGRNILAAQKQSHSVSDALQWIHTIAGMPFQTSLVPSYNFIEDHTEDPVLIVKSVKSLFNKGLLNYLEQRGIPESVGIKSLKEVRIYNTKTQKNIFALGLINESDAYEVRNPFFKGCIGPKDISFIRGINDKPMGIHLFEGFMDYLSAITNQNGKLFADDVIILNSLSCIKMAIPYIQGYGYQKAFTWMDNDSSGQSATLFLENLCSNEQGLEHRPMNDIYKPFKDLNAWHMHKLEL